MSKKGFTLIELLAVIVILAIILGIAIPGITNIIKNTSRSAFESDAKMVIKAAEYRRLEDESFDPISINKSNIKKSLGIDDSNYDQVRLDITNSKLRVIIVGKDKWNGLVACGTIKNITVTDNIEDCNKISVPPVITMLGVSNVYIELGMQYIDAGATAVNLNNIDISNDIVVTNNVNSNVMGTYQVIYTVTDAAGNVATAVRTVNVIPPPYTYSYTGDSQTFNVPKTGKYKIELWGASAATSAGRGAYTSGEIILSKDETLYIYVGQGNLETKNVTSFNGGTATGNGFPGGGATDVRLIPGDWNNLDSLKSRIMVSAGAGSGTGNSTVNHGYGGTLTGGPNPSYKGASQTDTGTGGYDLAGFGYAGGGCAGGNGYYGAKGANCTNGAAGGSSFISGYTGCNAISSISTATNIVHTGQPVHYSGKVFTKGVMIAGNTSMPTHDGASTMIGNSGNGYAKITYLGADINITIRGDKPVILYKMDTYVDAGATAVDSNNVDISNSIVATSNVNTSVIGTYQVIYTATDASGNISTAIRFVDVIGLDFAFIYTGDYQTFNVPKAGKYKIELWGASAATASGRGAYTSGETVLSKDEKLYIYVGQGNLGVRNATSFNGGTASGNGYPGGGATDIRLTPGDWNNFDSLKSRIMVSAGAGSGTGNSTINHGYGGTLTGGPSPVYKGASQTDTGTGGYDLAGFGYTGGGCVGGNGYYGAKGAVCGSGAAGGSSFISGYTGCNAISESSTSTNIVHTGQPNHYSGKVFTDGVMIAGNAAMPTYDGTSTMIGNSGNGYAKITFIFD